MANDHEIPEEDLHAWVDKVQDFIHEDVSGEHDQSEHNTEAAIEFIQMAAEEDDYEPEDPWEDLEDDCNDSR